MRGDLKEKSFPLSPWYSSLFSGTLSTVGEFNMIERYYEWIWPKGAEHDQDHDHDAGTDA